MSTGSGRRPRPAPQPFLDLLEPADRDFIKARCSRQSYPEGAHLFQQGEPAGRLIVLQAGAVKVSSSVAGSADAVLAFRGAGDVLGEMSSVDDGPRSATVTALSRVTALVLEPPAVAELLRRPTVTRVLLKVVVHRLREADRLRLLLGPDKTVSQRVAALLSVLIKFSREGPNGTIELDLTQKDLANAVRARREAVNRALREFAGQGILTTHRTWITINRPDELHRAGE